MKVDRDSSDVLWDSEGALVWSKVSFCFCFETESHYTALAVLERTEIYLPLPPPKCMACNTTPGGSS